MTNSNETYIAFQERQMAKHGLHRGPVFNAIFSLAWEEGHSSGYQEVELYFDRIMDVVRVVQEETPDPEKRTESEEDDAIKDGLVQAVRIDELTGTVSLLTERLVEVTKERDDLMEKMVKEKEERIKNGEIFLKSLGISVPPVL